MNFSRKQYSPLNPSSPDDQDSPPERLDIDLMHELRDVIFPNTPPVDRSVSTPKHARCFFFYLVSLQLNMHKYRVIRTCACALWFWLTIFISVCARVFIGCILGLRELAFVHTFTRAFLFQLRGFCGFQFEHVTLPSRKRYFSIKFN